MTINELIARFGLEVRKRRESLNMTLEIFAEASNLTPNYIGTIENGKRDPSLSTVYSLARGLGVTAGELLGPTPKLSPEALETARLFDGVTAKIQEAILMILRAVATPKPK